MTGTAATPGALILLAGAALFYWAFFTPSGILARSRSISSPTPLPPDGNGNPNPIPDSGGGTHKKGDAKARYLQGLPPPSPNVLGHSYAQQKAAFMAAIRSVEGGPNSVNPKSGAYGSYQIIPSTWNAWSRHYFGKVLPKTPANSELLASRRIDDYYRTYSKKIAKGELPNNVSIWARIAVSWSRGPSVGKRPDWRDWKQHGYLYATNVLWKFIDNLNAMSENEPR